MLGKIWMNERWNWQTWNKIDRVFRWGRIGARLMEAARRPIRSFSLYSNFFFFNEKQNCTMYNFNFSSSFMHNAIQSSIYREREANWTRGPPTLRTYKYIERMNRSEILHQQKSYFKHMRQLIHVTWYVRR